MAELKEIIGNPHPFLDDIIKEIEDAGIDLDDFSQMDHMCYRTETLQGYYLTQARLREVSKLLGETMVNGRPISTFRLDDPVYHDRWRIDALELPAPKEGKPLPEGLEHVELVMYDDIDTFLAKYDGLPFDLRSVDRGINPEIGLKLVNFSVKFHLLSLPTVVFLENKLGIKEVADGQS